MKASEVKQIMKLLFLFSTALLLSYQAQHIQVLPDFSKIAIVTCTDK